MATLNTLRTRGGVIVSIVIGIALLSFLLGDFGTSGANMMNERKMQVGKINGEKIGYTDFSNQLDSRKNVLETLSGSNLTSEQQDNIQNQVWENLIMEYAWMPGFEEVGLKVTDNEQLDMINGSFISPIIRMYFSDPNTGVYNGTIVQDFVANISKDPTGRSAMIWDFFKDQMIQERFFSKYLNLVAKGMYVNDLEVEQGVANADVSSSISYIMREYTAIPDSTITVPQADIQKYYDAHKNSFRQTNSRDIEYVLFDVLPSEADYAEAEKTINNIAEEFAASETPFQYAVLNSQEQPDKTYRSEEELPTEMATFAFGKDQPKMYGPVKEGDVYTLTRVADVKMIPDSLGARHILIKAGETERADSIVTALKGGASFDELSKLYSLDQAAAANGGDLGIFTADRMVPEFSEAVINTDKGEYFTVETQFGLHIGEVTYKSTPKKKVQLATIVYRIDPSDATQQEIYAKASKFVGEVAGSYENFEKAAEDNSLSKRVVRIKNTDRDINGLDNSREIVRWAFNGKKGDVSSILEVDGNYVVAAITGVTEAGIAPMEAVAAQITAILRAKMKGEMLTKEMTGSSLAEVAGKYNLEEKQASDIEFNTLYIEGVGAEAKLIGAVTGAPENTLSKPVTGINGVYLFDVTSRKTLDNVTPESERVRLEANAESYISERLMQALMDQSDITDNRVKFF